MPDYTENPNDPFTDIARLSGHHAVTYGNDDVAGGAPENKTIALSALQSVATDGTLVWAASAHVLNNRSGIAVGAIFTIANPSGGTGGTQEYEITKVEDHGKWTEAGANSNGAVVTARVQVTPGVTDPDQDANNDDHNKGALATRKFQGTHKSLADHLRLRRQGII